MSAATADPTPDGPGMDATISMVRANVLALLAFPAALVPVGLHAVLWGPDSMVEGAKALFPWWFFPLFVVSIVTHEALHGLGFLLGGAPRSSLRFGIDRKTLSPFAGCGAPLSARSYRVAVLLPAVLLGALPLAAGLALGSGTASVWGAFMLFAAGGDFAAVWAMRSVPPGARVLDHPGRVGCKVVG